MYISKDVYGVKYFQKMLQKLDFFIFKQLQSFQKFYFEKYSIRFVKYLQLH